MVHFQASEKTNRDLPRVVNTGIPWSMSSYEETLKKLRQVIEARYKNISGLASAMGIPPNRVSRWLSGERGPRYKELAEIFDFLGVRVSFPGESMEMRRNVVWVEPKKTLAVQASAANPDATRYAAVPLAEGAVAAGPGLIPDDSVRGWVLALKEHSSIRYRSNLVAVEVGKGQLSMVPTLHPLDIVLVDRDDTRPEPDGSIFLVRDPDDAVAVKRVFVQRKNGGTLLQYVSDNADKREYPPMVFSLESDFGGEMRRAIVGRVVWAWKDMTRK